MALFANSVLYNPVSNGTADFVTSAAVTGFMTPALTSMQAGVYKYRAESSDLTQWEIGEGTYTPGTQTLTRTTVLYNSAGTGIAAGQSGAGTKINFTAAPNVGVVMMKQDVISAEESNGFSDAQKVALRRNVGVPQVYAQCRLVKSGSNIVLIPYNGNLLSINGAPQAIPNSGVSLAPTGLTANTTYYIYAYMSSGTMTLEASTTGYGVSVTNGNDGCPIKTGDDTRTLVGLTRIITGPAWVDTAAQRFVRSYWNRQRVNVVGSLDTTSTETNVSSYIEKTVSKAEFVCFSDDGVLGGFYGMATNSTQPFLGMQIFADGGAVGPALDWNILSAGSRTVYNPMLPMNFGDGYHYISFALRALGGGTVTLATYTGMQAQALVG